MKPETSSKDTKKQKPRPLKPVTFRKSMKPHVEIEYEYEHETATTTENSKTSY
jgi:hypothetical protein